MHKISISWIFFRIDINDLIDDDTMNGLKIKNGYNNDYGW